MLQEHFFILPVSAMNNAMLTQPKRENNIVFAVEMPAVIDTANVKPKATKPTVDR